MENKIAMDQIISHIRKACPKSRYNFSPHQTSVNRVVISMQVSGKEDAKEDSGYRHYIHKRYFHYKRRKCHWKRDSFLERLSNRSRYNKTVSQSEEARKNIRSFVNTYMADLKAIRRGSDVRCH